jgi:hypothetical protein
VRACAERRLPRHRDKQRLIDKLKGNYVQLALSKYGSYCLERCFNAADPFHKVPARYSARGSHARRSGQHSPRAGGSGLEDARRSADQPPVRAPPRWFPRATGRRGAQRPAAQPQVEARPLHQQHKGVRARLLQRLPARSAMRSVLTRLAQLWESVMKDQRSAPRRFDDFLQELDGAGTPAAAAPAKRRRQE